MNYRLATIFAETTYSDDATEIIDVNVKDPVSQLIIRFQARNGIGANSTAHPMKCLSKIELVDGSDILFSLSGPEAHALDWYSHMVERPNIMWYLPSQVQEMALHISFGRFLYDPILALDPAKFTNLQLKITLNVGGGGMNNDQIVMSIVAHLFDEKTVTPAGFLMSKEIKDYALGAGTHEYTDLPVDYPYRKLLLRTQKDGVGTEYCFDTLKLSEDNDKRIPFNNKILEILHAITAQGRPYREWIGVGGGSADRYFHCTPAYWPGFSISHWEGSAIAQDATIWGGDGQYARLLTTGVGGNYQALCEGWCPQGVVEIPFGLQNDPADWYQTANIGTLRLDLKSGGGMSPTETCQVFIQQHRPY